MNEFAERQKRIAEYVLAYKAEHGRAPTDGHVAETLGLTIAVVRNDMRALRRENKLSWLDGFRATTLDKGVHYS